mgnify:FL=1
MKIISFEFVEHIPEKLDEGIIYVSLKYCTAVHKCCCGCQEEVVTPLSPVDWQLTFDGKTITLDPSIGNWGLKCQSHYWIRKNKIIWSEKWPDSKIKLLQEADQIEKEEYYKIINKKRKRLWKWLFFYFVFTIVWYLHLSGQIPLSW